MYPEIYCSAASPMLGTISESAFEDGEARLSDVNRL